jgi:hypothetical protein
MDKETALKELNRLCDERKSNVPVQADEFTAIEFAQSRGIAHRTASGILREFEKEGIVSRRHAYMPSGGKTVWKFIQKGTPPRDPLPESNLQIDVRYPIHSE